MTALAQPDRTELRARYGDEQVLVIPHAATAALPAGIVAEFSLAALLRGSSYLPRWQAEYNPDWRQLVTYIALRQGERLFLTERFRSQGESRLHSLYSLGVGGHVNRSDQGDPVESGWRRELAEELRLDWSVARLAPAALINDLSNAVSRDHLGVFFVVDIPAGACVQVRETDKMQGRLLAIDRIRADYCDRLESWSQLVLDHLQKAHI